MEQVVTGIHAGLSEELIGTFHREFVDETLDRLRDLDGALDDREGGGAAVL